MKKIHFLIFTVVLTVVFTCSYIITGKIVHKTYYQTIAELNQQGDSKVSLVNYKRGLFSSYALVTINYQGKDITLQQKLIHGPIIAAKKENSRSLEVAAVQIFSSTDDKELAEIFHANSIVGFNNKAKTHLKLNSLNQKSENNLEVYWDRVSAEFSHDLNFKNYTADIKIPKLAIKKPMWEFNTQNLEFTTNTKTSPFKETKANKIKAQNITFSKDSNVILGMRNFDANLGLENELDTVNLDLTGNIGYAEVLHQKFANENFEFSLKNANPKLFKQQPNAKELNPLAIALLTQKYASECQAYKLKIPKYFTESLLTYISFEVYRASDIGRLDAREDAIVYKDIDASIKKMIQTALRHQIFSDNGAFYVMASN